MEQTESTHFEFEFEPMFEKVGWALGITPSTTGVDVTRDGELFFRFGPWRVETHLDNVRSATLTGPYAIPKTIGPAHLSLRDRGLTFATNHRLGVCIEFEDAVGGIEPFGIIRHPGLTVTVKDAPEFAALMSLGSSAEHDAHTHDIRDDVHDDLLGLTAAELRGRAAALGLTGTSRMSKAQLLDLLDPTMEPAP